MKHKHKNLAFWWVLNPLAPVELEKCQKLFFKILQYIASCMDYLVTYTFVMIIHKLNFSKMFSSQNYFFEYQFKLSCNPLNHYQGLDILLEFILNFHSFFL